VQRTAMDSNRRARKPRRMTILRGHARFSLAAAGLLAALTSAVLSGCAIRAEGAGARQVAYVGLRGDGRVAVYDVHRESGEWTLKQVVAVREGDAGWATSAPIAVSPDRRRLHVGMRAAGQVATYAIANDGRLSFVDTAEIGGSAPFLWRERSGRWLLASYFPEGKVTVHRIDERGAVVSGAVQEVPTAPNAHAILPDRSNGFVFVPHTGPNAIYQFRFDEETGRLTPNQPPTVQPPEGRGPRHARFHPDLPVVYVINETASTVTAYRFDPATGTLAEFQEMPTLPADHTGDNSTADLHLTPDGAVLYGSNRGHDSLVAYRIDRATGRLYLVDWFETERTPRSFAIDPGGRFLYVAGQGSGNVAGYRIDRQTGRLARFATFAVGDDPTWIEIVTLP
jgi:6-phosphogluconolactonase